MLKRRDIKGIWKKGLKMKGEGGGLREESGMENGEDSHNSIRGRGRTYRYGKEAGI